MPKLEPRKRIVRPDSKGRISLGKRAREFRSYRMTECENGAILLEPLIEIPAREESLFKNKEALASVRRGLKQSASGKTKPLGSFSQYTEEDDQ